MIAIRIAGALALAAVLGAAPVARAQEDWEEMDSDAAQSSWRFGQAREGGFYTAIGGFLAAPNTEGFDDVAGGAGFSARGGYRANSYFAAELVLDWVEGFNRSNGSELETLFLGGNLKVHYPLRFVQPYAQLGIGYFHASPGRQNFDNAASRTGFGFEIPLTRHFGLDIDAAYVWVWDDHQGADYAMIGLGAQYWF